MLGLHRIYILLFWLVLSLFMTSQVSAEEKPPSSTITVEKNLLTFDPKTCYKGQATLGWGWGSNSVKLIGHQDNNCVFEYIAEIEMGESHYLVKVPIDSGPVSIKTNQPNQPATFGIVTSFDLSKAKLLRSGSGGGGWRVPIGETGKYAIYQPSRMNSEMSAKIGDKVRLRTRLFKDSEYKEELEPGVHRDARYDMVLGAGEIPCLEAAMDQMTVGDTRRVSFPRSVRGKYAEHLPDTSGGETLYVELDFVYLEAAKK
jgi:hypothetical protein